MAEIGIVGERRAGEGGSENLEVRSCLQRRADKADRSFLVLFLYGGGKLVGIEGGGAFGIGEFVLPQRVPTQMSKDFEQRHE